jgi:ribonucleotide reductase alpha subunit
MRNASLTSVARAGSTSILLDVYSGIEPCFGLQYDSSSASEFVTMTITIANPYIKAALQKVGCWNEETERQLSETATLKNIKGIPDEIRNDFVL